MSMKTLQHQQASGMRMSLPLNSGTESKILVTEKGPWFLAFPSKISERKQYSEEWHQNYLSTLWICRENIYFGKGRGWHFKNLFSI